MEVCQYILQLYQYNLYRIYMCLYKVISDLQALIYQKWKLKFGKNHEEVGAINFQSKSLEGS